MAVGWTADLIVVNGNPAADITDLTKAERVIKNGVAYEAEGLGQGAGGLALTVPSGSGPPFRPSAFSGVVLCAM